MTFPSYSAAYAVAWFEFVEIVEMDTLSAPTELNVNSGFPDFVFYATLKGGAAYGNAGIRTAGSSGSYPTIDTGKKHRTVGYKDVKEIKFKYDGERPPVIPAVCPDPNSLVEEERRRRDEGRSEPQPIPQPVPGFGAFMESLFEAISNINLPPLPIRWPSPERRF